MPDASPTPTGSTDGWAPLSTQEVVDLGLLHHWNALHFWPDGLALTATRIDPVERMQGGADPRPVLVEVLRPTLAELMGEIEADRLLDAAAQAIAENLLGKVVEGLYLTMTVPPEAVQTALSPQEARERQSRAAAWLIERRASIR